MGTSHFLEKYSILMSVQRILPRIKETLESKDFSDDLKQPCLFFIPSKNVRAVVSSSTKQGHFLLSILHLLLNRDNISFCDTLERDEIVTDKMKFIDVVVNYFELVVEEDLSEDPKSDRLPVMLPIGNIQFTRRKKSIKKSLNEIEIWNFHRIHAKFTKMFHECRFNRLMGLSCQFCDVDNDSMTE